MRGHLHSGSIHQHMNARWASKSKFHAKFVGILRTWFSWPFAHSGLCYILIIWAWHKAGSVTLTYSWPFAGDSRFVTPSLMEPYHVLDVAMTFFSKYFKALAKSLAFFCYYRNFKTNLSALQNHLTGWLAVHFMPTTQFRLENTVRPEIFVFCRAFAL